VLVSDIDLRAQLRLLEVRRELERLMARGAAERASEDERAQFSDIAAGMSRASESGDDISFMRLDRQFNALVSSAARNEFASRSMGLMHGLSRRFWYQHYKEAADLPLCARLHAAVAEAITRREADQAAAASDRLMDYIESFARSTL
jgi:DNA-binding GntR family transcriptional regulator